MTSVDFMFLDLFYCNSLWWELSEVGGDDAPLEGYRTRVTIDTIGEKHYHSINGHRGVPCSACQDHA